MNSHVTTIDFDAYRDDLLEAFSQSSHVPFDVLDVAEKKSNDPQLVPIASEQQIEDGKLQISISVPPSQLTSAFSWENVR